MCGVVKPTLIILFLCANPSLLWLRVYNTRTSFEDVRYHFEFLETTLRGFEPGSLAQHTHHFTTTPHIPRFLSALLRCLSQRSRPRGRPRTHARPRTHVRACTRVRPQTHVRHRTHFLDTPQRSGHCKQRPGSFCAIIAQSCSTRRTHTLTGSSTYFPDTPQQSARWKQRPRSDCAIIVQSYAVKSHHSDTSDAYWFQPK